MRRKQLQVWLLFCAALGIGLAAFPQDVQGQQLTNCLSADTTDCKITGTFLGLWATKVQIGVQWTPSDSLRRMAAGRILIYRVICDTTSTFKRPVDTSGPLIIYKHVFTNLRAKQQYYFRVSAFIGDDNRPVCVISQPVLGSYPTAKSSAGGTSWFSRWSKQTWAVLYIMGVGLAESSILGQLGMILAFGLAFIGYKVYRRNRRVLQETTLFPTNNQVAKDSEHLKAIIETLSEGVENASIDEDLVQCAMVTVEDFREGSPIHLLSSSKSKDLVGQASGGVKWADMPTVRILKAGVKARSCHIRFPNNDFNHVHEDIKKAMDESAEKEANELSGKAVVDYLWYIGFTTPLLGLFGTVTGLGGAFHLYSQTPNGMVNDIAPGIAEAIATTIWGLLIGVPLMLAYYYYSYKLERIAATWAKMGAHFADNCVGQARPSEAKEIKQ